MSRRVEYWEEGGPSTRDAIFGQILEELSRDGGVEV
jgi:hypothetical protein